jgi:hypothetical protein
MQIVFDIPNVSIGSMRRKFCRTAKVIMSCDNLHFSGKENNMTAAAWRRLRSFNAAIKFEFGIKSQHAKNLETTCGFPFQTLFVLNFGYLTLFFEHGSRMLCALMAGKHASLLYSWDTPGQSTFSLQAPLVRLVRC